MTKLLSFVLIFFNLYAYAQQNVGYRQANIVSPQINEDNTVTFSLWAPYSNSVYIKGDWEANKGIGQMQKNDKGIWTFTTEKLPSDLYMYSFLLDSVRVLDPSNSFSYRDVGNLYSIFIVNKGNGDEYSVNDVPHGTVQKSWYNSPSLKSTRRLTIYTPPGYETSTKKYPVLYLLHGSGGDEEAWITLGRTAQIMDNLIAENKIEPMIVVMPNGNSSKEAAPGETSENFDYKPVMSQYIPNLAPGAYEMSFPEIVKYTDSQFRTIPEKKSRAIAGLSMGGFHSLVISANYPDLFDYVGLFSPGTPASRLNFKSETSAFTDLPAKYTKQKDAGYSLYWIAVGDDDFLYKSLQEQKKQFDDLNFPYTYVESRRGHIWSNWRAYMLQFTPLLFKK